MVVTIRLPIVNVPFGPCDTDLPIFKYDGVDTWPSFLNTYFGDGDEERVVTTSVVTSDDFIRSVTIDLKVFNEGLKEARKINIMEMTDQFETAYYRVHSHQYNGGRKVTFILHRDVYLSSINNLKFMTFPLNKQTFVKRTHFDRFYRATGKQSYKRTSVTIDVKEENGAIIVFDVNRDPSFELTSVSVDAVDYQGNKVGEQGTLSGSTNYYWYLPKGLYNLSKLVINSTVKFNIPSQSPIQIFIASGDPHNVVMKEVGIEFTFSDPVVPLTNSENNMLIYQSQDDDLKLLTLKSQTDYLHALSTWLPSQGSMTSVDILAGPAAPINGVATLVNDITFTAPTDATKITDIEDGFHFDFRENSNLWLNDPSVNHYIGVKAFHKSTAAEREVNSEVLKIDKQPTYPDFKPVLHRYMYAFVSLNAIFFNETNAGSEGTPNKGLAKGYVHNEEMTTFPILIIPLNAIDDTAYPNNEPNSYQNIISAGNSAVVKVFGFHFPLILSQAPTVTTGFPDPITLTEDEFTKLGGVRAWDSEKVFDFWYNNLTPDSDVGDLRLMSEGCWLEFIEYSKLPYKNFYSIDELKDIDNKTNSTTVDLEPKLFMYPHFDVELQHGKSTRDVRNEYLWSDFTNDKTNASIGGHPNSLSFTTRLLPSLTQLSTIGFIENGFYKFSNNIQDSGYAYTSTHDIPATNNSETNYFQNHKNAVANSKWTYGQQEKMSERTAKANEAAGDTKAVAGALGGALTNAVSNPFAAGASLLNGAAAVAGNAMVAGAAIANAHTQRQIQDKTLDAKLQDLERPPFTLNGVGVDDYLNTTLLQKLYIDVSDPLPDEWVKACPQTYLNYKSLPDEPRKLIQTVYSTKGYLYGKMMELTYDKLTENRVSFNYWEIPNIEECIDRDSIDPKSLEVISGIFKRGVRLWNWGGGLPFRDYSSENWERSVRKVLDS